MIKLLNGEHEFHLNHPLRVAIISVGFCPEIFCALYNIAMIIVEPLIALYLQFVLTALNKFVVIVNSSLCIGKFRLEPKFDISFSAPEAKKC